MRKITVLLSDDHAVFREGLRSLLHATEDIDVVGEAENGHRAVAEARRLQPDVVIMDVAMPRLNGLEATRRITRQAPAAKVLILSNYYDQQYVQRALEAGAIGYLRKESAWREVLQAIRDACKENNLNSPIASGLLKQGQKPAFQSQSQFNAAPKLTGRQTEVLRLIAEGCTSKRIAILLSLSIKTVEKHRQMVMDKLDLHEVAALTRYAVSRGLVETNFAPMARPGALATWTAPSPSEGLAPNGESAPVAQGSAVRSGIPDDAPDRLGENCQPNGSRDWLEH